MKVLVYWHDGDFYLRKLEEPFDLERQRCMSDRDWAEHQKIVAGAVEITDEQYQDYLEYRKQYERWDHFFQKYAVY